MYASLIRSLLNHLEVDLSPRQKQNKGNVSVLVVERARHHSSTSKANSVKDLTVTSPKTFFFFFHFVHPPSEIKGNKECDPGVTTNQFSSFGKAPKRLTGTSEKAKIMLTDEARKQSTMACSALKRCEL